jgi:hypothetical protein
LGVVSLMAESTTGVLMSPGYGGYQSTALPSYYATTSYDMTSYYTEAPKYYTTKEPGSVTQLQMPRQLITPRLPSTTLLSATTPRLQLITPLKQSNITQK